MKKNNVIKIFVVFLFIVSSAFAEATSFDFQNSDKDYKSVKNLVHEYYVQRTAKQLYALNHQALNKPKCEDGVQAACINTVCSKLSSLACDDERELQQVAMICINNKDGSCIDAVCKRLSPLGCDDFHEVKDIAQTCSGLMDSSCIEAVCSRLSRLACDETHELKKVVEACKGP